MPSVQRAAREFKNKPVKITHMKLNPIIYFSILIACLATASTQTETSSIDELVKLKQNPVSGLRQVSLDVTLSPNVPVTGGTEGSYSTQIVWPFSMGEDWKLISYTIIPVLQEPRGKGSYDVGLGNTLINFFAAPAKPDGNFVWGAGPAILLPTHTDSTLGSDRLGLGPSTVFYYAEDQWGAGLVLQNIWSMGGNGRDEVNAFDAQYFLNYNLPKGWFLYSNASITADWLSPSSDRWTIPVGGGIGKVFTIGKQSASAAIQSLYNAVRADDAPDWALNFQFSLLFP